jgi:hypothetical protein
MMGVTNANPDHCSTQKAALPAATPANTKVTSRGNQIFVNDARMGRIIMKFNCACA